MVRQGEKRLCRRWNLLDKCVPAKQQWAPFCPKAVSICLKCISSPMKFRAGDEETAEIRCNNSWGFCPHRSGHERGSLVRLQARESFVLKDHEMRKISRAWELKQNEVLWKAIRLWTISHRSQQVRAPEKLNWKCRRSQSAGIVYTKVYWVI